MDIDSELVNLDTNFDKTVTSLKNSVEYWERYYLTSPGRINVIKSLLFPLILYLGCFLMPSLGKIKLMQTILDNFAIGSLNFGKKRITMPVEQGWLGLFDVEEFLSGQQAGWVLKAKKSSRDNWRCNLRSLCYGNMLCAGPDLISSTHNPILFGIAKSFACFRSHHDLLHSNFTNAFIMNNKIFTRGPRDKGILTYSYLELDEKADCRISRLKAFEFFNVNGLKTRLELTIQYGINLTLPGYANLALCLNNYVRKLRPNLRNNGSSRDICTEFLSLKNPGKKIWSWYRKKIRLSFNIRETKFFGTFHTITQATLPAGPVLRHRISMWNCTGLTNRLKTFIFKFYNNLLGLNTRLSHFVINQSRGCTFCHGTADPVPDETFLHLFYDCPVTTSPRGTINS